MFGTGRQHAPAGRALPGAIPRLLLVARGADNELAGYTTRGARGNPEFDLDAPIAWSPRSPCISTIARRGIAGTLLVSLFAARACGLTHAMLDVEPDNAGALSLYARHGFRADRDSRPSGEPRVTLDVSLI